MVTWTILKNHFLEVGLTQNRETMTIRTLTTVELLYSIIREVATSVFLSTMYKSIII